MSVERSKKLSFFERFAKKDEDGQLPSEPPKKPDVPKTEKDGKTDVTADKENEVILVPDEPESSEPSPPKAPTSSSKPSGEKSGGEAKKAVTPASDPKQKSILEMFKRMPKASVKRPIPVDGGDSDLKRKKPNTPESKSKVEVEVVDLDEISPGKKDKPEENTPAKKEETEQVTKGDTEVQEMEVEDVEPEKCLASDKPSVDIPASTPSKLEENKNESDEENSGAEEDVAQITPSRSETKSSDEKKPTSSTKKSAENKTPKIPRPRKSRKSDPETEKAKEARRLERELKQKQKEEEKKRKEEERKQKEEEKRQKEEERKQKEEERKQKEEERKQKKEEEKRMKEEKEKEKERKKKEKEEQKEKERLEKEAKLKAKEEELKQKEEEKKKQEEEKKKEEEAKKQKEAKQKQVFAKFFVKVDTPSTPVAADVKTDGSRFKPFSVKDDMRLAPMKRAELSKERIEGFDSAFETQATDKSGLYLAELKTRNVRRTKGVPTFPARKPEEEFEDDIRVIDEESANIIIGPKTTSAETLVVPKRAKLLLFHENYRPAYWGTWRKSSPFITARKPFGKDTDLLNYEVDSDDEWEDEEENAESLKGDSDEDKESDDDYEIDNEFFVPHGYLSDGEGDTDDEIAEEPKSADPDEQKNRLKMMAAEFEEERKQKTKRLHPVLIGPYWQVEHDDDSGYEAGAGVEDTKLAKWLTHMSAFGALLCADQPGYAYSTFRPPPKKEKAEKAPGSASARGRQKREFPADGVVHLVKFLNGHSSTTKVNKKTLASEFMELWAKVAAEINHDVKTIPRIQIIAKIKEISTFSHEHGMWLVKDEILSQYPDVEKRKLSPSKSADSTGRKRKKTKSLKTATQSPEASKIESIKKFTKIVEPQDLPQPKAKPKEQKVEQPPAKKSGPMDLFLGKKKKEPKPPSNDDDVIMIE